MCFIRPLQIIKIKGNEVVLENGIKAYYDRKIGVLKRKDKVLVYGNLVMQKVNKLNTYHE
ncbi:MAG: hypothetical protein US11_C0001G0025 [Candidatus Roizmanbacteria bacterium GW2011_GWA2_36_23]|uniref:Uncharacterized protein n=1 Tax=Candidatus Roizmanbacteria bacterium GW2011_GWA2_36_23 TaxID=1618480 RepID=A0A0G0HDP5_9BACT|nr:MAG: hypothetical protein US11_C0001G0025 [Candidatus Roizmanbacteria bacterium GW2011_GWA2_36_23]